MSRKQRIDLAHEIYYCHLSANGQRGLFADRQDYRAFLPLLERLHTEKSATTLAWCLLANDIHLVLRSGPDGILDNLSWLKQVYTEEENARQQRSGSVFSNSTHCTLIAPKNWLAPVIHTLHYLPVQNALVAEPSIYPWSSYAAYKTAPASAWFDPDTALNLIANQRAGRIIRFENAMLREPKTLDLHNGNHPRYRALVTDNFIERRLGPDQNTTTEPSISDIYKLVSETYGLSAQDFQIRRQQRQAREALALIAALAESYANLDYAGWASAQGIDSANIDVDVTNLKMSQGWVLQNLQQALDKQLACGVKIEGLSLSQEGYQSDDTEPEPERAGE